ncbi:MAG: 5-bromo-4-chloroindolyl phosphate hydrolysis family protein [Pseudomonadota bacterium]
MAQRYGGQFSPDGQRDPARDTVNAPRPPELSFRGRAPQRYGAKLNLLFLIAAITLVPAFFQGQNGSVAGLAVGIAASAVLLLAAWLTRDGVRAEDAYRERKVARKPAIPRKIFGSVLTGLGVAGLAYGGAGGIASAVLGGGLAGALHLVTFGLDPMRDKGLAGMNHAETDRVARKIEEAENLLDQMKDAILRAKDRSLETRVETFQATARDMFRVIEEDPRDLSRARRYLGVYLQGARDATVKFADIWSRGQDYAARTEYLALLDDLETGFSERTKAMLLDDKSDLDIEIEVLRDRLNQDIRHMTRE